MTDLQGTDLVDWRQLPPSQRREWWEQRWESAIALSQRYRLALRSGWWEDSLQVEALAAFTGWLSLYDTGAYTDPPGKLQLLWELERLRAVLRAGEHAFEPGQDRAAFDRHLDRLLRPSREASADAVSGEGPVADRTRHRRHQREELSGVLLRITELQERQRILEGVVDDPRAWRGDAFSQAKRDLAEVRRTLPELERRQQELERRLVECRC